MSKQKKNNGIKVMIAAVLVIIAAGGVWLFTKAEKEAERDEKFTMSTNAERIDFLNKNGWIVKPDPVSKDEITIPAEFNEVYEEYAAFQREQGFELENYKGREVTLISYSVLNYPGITENVTANMLMCDDLLIGGEITLDEENGFTEPIVQTKVES
jgi:hypothetical protein